MAKNSLLNPTPRADRYAGCTCAVDGCSRFTRPLSRFCANHYQRYRRTRHPTGFLPTRKDLRPYRELAREALEDWGYGDKPAVVAAEACLQRLVADTGTVPAKYRGHFRRLQTSGVTGRQMLLEVLAVYGLRHLGPPGSTHQSEATFHCALGSRLLRCAPLDDRGADWATGKRLDPHRPTGTSCAMVGEAIAQNLGAMPLLLWRAVEEERITRFRKASAHE